MSIILFMLACTEFTPHMSAVWNEVPQTVVCDNNDMNDDNIIEALNQWIDISEEYTTDYVGLDSCQGDRPPSGVIWFVEATEEELAEREDRWDVCQGCLAAFATQTTDDSQDVREMLSAVVHAKSTSRVEIIQHEVGHAFGWGHTTRDDGYGYGHVMSPHDSDGLSAFGLEHYSDLLYYEE